MRIGLGTAPPSPWDDARGRRRAGAALALLWCLACAHESAARTRAYVTDDAAHGGVKVIDTVDSRVIATIPLDGTPAGLVAAPDGRTVYVANRTAATIAAIRPATNRVVNTFVIPEAGGDEGKFLPGAISLNRDGTQLYVALDYPDGCPFDASLGQVDTTTGAVGFAWGFGDGHIADVALAADGALYAAVEGGCSDSSYYAGFAAGAPLTDTLYGQFSLVESHTPVPSGDLVIERGASTAYVATTATNTVTAVDLPSLRRFAPVTRTIPVGIEPVGLALSPDNRRLYAVNRCGGDPTCGGVGSLSIVDTATHGVVADVAVDKAPVGVALSPDGGLVYVTNHGSASLWVIAAYAEVVTDTIDTGGTPSRVVVIDVQPACFGDCDDSGTVTVDDLLTLTNVMLGTAPLSTCPAAELWHDCGRRKLADGIRISREDRGTQDRGT
jgi:YVTN family beta-propeller protein